MAFTVVNPEVIEIPVTGFPTDSHDLSSANRLFICTGTVVWDSGPIIAGVLDDIERGSIDFKVVNNNGSDLIFDITRDEVVYRTTTHVSLASFHATGNDPTFAVDSADADLKENRVWVTVNLAVSDGNIDRLGYQVTILARKFDNLFAAPEDPVS